MLSIQSSSRLLMTLGCWPLLIFPFLSGPYF